MAEVLGTIASLITIAQTLEPVLSLARTIYKAQKELKDVQVSLGRWLVLRTADNANINVMLAIHTNRVNRRISQS